MPVLRAPPAGCWRALRDAARAARPPARARRRVPRLPAHAPRSSTRALADAGLRVLAEDEGPSAYRFSRDRFLRLARAHDRRRARRLRRPARRGRRSPSSGGRSSRSTSSSLGLPLHNIVMSLLYGGGVRGGALDAIQAWKEIVLAAALALGRARVPSATRRLPFRPISSTALALAFARDRRPLRGDPAERARRRTRAPGRSLYGLRHDLVLVAAYFLGRSVAARQSGASALVIAVARGRSRGLGPDRGLRRADRVVAPLRRGRLLPPRARLRLPRPGRAAGELRLQHERRPLPPARLDVRLAARDRLHARRRAAPARDRPAPARGSPVALAAVCARRAALDVLALVDRRARGRARRARRRPGAAGGRVAGRGRRRRRRVRLRRDLPRRSRRGRTGSRPTSRTRRRRRRRRARCRRASGLDRHRQPRRAVDPAATSTASATGSTDGRRPPAGLRARQRRARPRSAST